MTDPATIARPLWGTRRRRALEAAGHVLPPLLLLVVVLAFHPFREVVAFDPDEGNNLMKARLVADGHALYSEIWSDQPPLFTWMLCAWLDLTTWSVEAGRLLVLLCSCVLVWALYQVMRMTAGHVGAIASSLLLVTSAGYLRLSVSVMLAVPSLMFAMLSLWAVVRSRRDGRAAWPALAGVFLALALGVKLWTGLLVPVFALAVLTAARGPAAADPAPRAWRRSLAWWTVGFAATVIALFLATVPLGEAGQLLRPHLDVRGARDFHVHTMAFWGHFLEDAAVVLLAVPGLIFVVRRRDALAAVPALWAVLAAIVLAGHEPLWYHHYLMVSVPLCALAGIGVAGLVAVVRSPEFISWQGRRTILAWGTALPAGVAAVLLAVHAPGFGRANFAAWSSPDLLRDRHLVELMTRLPGDTHCVMTDRQILPFRAGLRVPPELSVTSLKRRWAGHLSDERLIALLAAYEPDQVFLSGQRLRVTGPLYEWLAPRYRHVYGDPWGGLFLVRNDLAPAAMTGLVEAAAAHEDCWEAQLNLAEVHAREGRVEEARRAFARALAAMPEDPGLAPVRKRLESVLLQLAEGE